MTKAGYDLSQMIRWDVFKMPFLVNGGWYMRDVLLIVLDRYIVSALPWRELRGCLKDMN